MLYSNINENLHQKNISSSDFMASILNESISKEKVAIWHLGQNSFILRSDDSPTISIDPYLTDFCGSGKTGERTEKSRFLPVFIEPEDLEVDLILLTHSHKDHTDIYTLERLNNLNEIKFFCPFQIVDVLKSLGVRENQINLIHPLEEIEYNNIKITGTYALPTDSTDLNHIGFLLEFPNKKKYYNTGDSSFTPLLYYLESYNINLMSICINGGYNNLSHFEAAKITKIINPEIVCPSHYDVMPHNYQPAEVFHGSLKTVKAESRFVKIEYFEPFFF